MQSSRRPRRRNIPRPRGNDFPSDRAPENVGQERIIRQRGKRMFCDVPGRRSCLEPAFIAYPLPIPSRRDKSKMFFAFSLRIDRIDYTESIGQYLGVPEIFTCFGFLCVRHDKHRVPGQGENNVTHPTQRPIPAQQQYMLGKTTDNRVKPRFLHSLFYASHSS